MSWPPNILPQPRSWFCPWKTSPSVRLRRISVTSSSRGDEFMSTKCLILHDNVSRNQRFCCQTDVRGFARRAANHASTPLMYTDRGNLRTNCRSVWYRVQGYRELWSHGAYLESVASQLKGESLHEITVRKKPFSHGCLCTCSCLW